MDHHVDLEQELDNLDRLPALPQALGRLLSMLDSRSSGGKDLAQVIEADPALATQILRTVNSARYGVGRRVSSVAHAVTLLGTRAIRRVALALGFRRTLEQGKRATGPPYSHREDFWEHSVTAAFLAEGLAEKFRLPGAGAAYAAGLLHDLGLMILDIVAPDILENLESRMSGGLDDILDPEIEEMGCTHPEIGRMAADRWGFPSDLVEAIATHHWPLEAPAASRKLACVVAVADAFASPEERRCFSGPTDATVRDALLHLGAGEDTVNAIREQALSRASGARELIAFGR